MGCLMRDLSQFVREDGQFKALNELTPEEIQIIDTIVRNADGTMTYRIGRDDVGRTEHPGASGSVGAGRIGQGHG